MFTQIILNLLYDIATAAFFYIYENTCCNLVFDSATAHIYICLWEFHLQWNLDSQYCTTSEQHIYLIDSQFGI